MENILISPLHFELNLLYRQESDCIHSLLVIVDHVHTMAVVLAWARATLVGVNITVSSLNP